MNCQPCNALVKAPGCKGENEASTALQAEAPPRALGLHFPGGPPQVIPHWGWPLVTESDVAQGDFKVVHKDTASTFLTGNPVLVLEPPGATCCEDLGHLECPSF